MVGVASRNTRTGANYSMLFGLWIGGAISTAVLGLLIAVLGQFIDNNSSAGVQLGVLVVSGMALATLDVSGKATSVNRQTPQLLLYDLRDFPLGLIYGMDIGTLFSIRKFSSLLWFGLISLLLIHPRAAPVVMLLGHTAWMLILLLEAAMSERKGFLYRLPAYRRMENSCRWLGTTLMLGSSFLLI